MNEQPEGQDLGANAGAALTEKIIRHTAASLDRRDGEALPPPAPAKTKKQLSGKVRLLTIAGLCLLAALAAAALLRRGRD
jgi:hypothetical protein